MSKVAVASRPSVRTGPAPRFQGLGALILAVLAMFRVSAADPPSPAKSKPDSAPSNDPIRALPIDPENPIIKIFGGARLDLWSLRPPRPAPVPRLDSEIESVHPIDHWLAHRFPEVRTIASQPLEPRALARRVAFDLTGLPPDLNWVRRLEDSSDPTAYERYVDALLASPRYGEHLARLWLDVVRYSDSNGFDWDEFRPHAWQYRDYVIRSLNADKPMDRFIIEQLAGDELLAGPPANEAEQDCLIATGYLRLGPHDNSAGAFNEQDRSRAELMFDLVETTGSAFLGLTLSCCRCHDHKFDPLSQADYFRFQAFFEPVRFADDLPTNLAADQQAIQRHNAAFDARIGNETRERDAILASAKGRLRRERIALLSDEERALLEAPSEKQHPELKTRIEGIRRKVDPREKEVRAALDARAMAEVKAIESRIAEFQAQKQPYQHALLMTDRTEAPEPTRVFFQGNHKDKRQAVDPGFPSVFDARAARIDKAPNTKTHGRRLALARWIASTNNPLAARVLANRIWQNTFGEGIVGTPNDFGYAGSRPVHPELLDWLALQLQDGGWSLKKLHRQIVTSRIYKSQAGDRNTPLSVPQALYRAKPLRLPAEPMRDALLAASGSLCFPSGGPPTWPSLPAEVLQANPAFLDDNAEKTKGWYPSPDALQQVRSVFLIQKRTVRVPFMEMFDLPENSTSCARRTRSIVAPQAFALLNDPLAVGAAYRMAQRVAHEAGGDRARQVDQIFLCALQRHPTSAERERFLKFLERRTLVEACRVALNLNEFAFVD